MNVVNIFLEESCVTKEVGTAPYYEEEGKKGNKQALQFTTLLFNWPQGALRISQSTLMSTSTSTMPLVYLLCVPQSSASHNLAT